MIKNFKNSATKKIYRQQFSKKFPKSIQGVALRKLLMINASKNIHDLLTLPGNCLEKLKGNRKG